MALPPLYFSYRGAKRTTFPSRCVSAYLPKDAWTINFVNTASKEILGIDYIPLEDSVIDMGKALIATGYIPPAATAAAS